VGPCRRGKNSNNTMGEGESKMIKNTSYPMHCKKVGEPKGGETFQSPLGHSHLESENSKCALYALYWGKGKRRGKREKGILLRKDIV